MNTKLYVFWMLMLVAVLNYGLRAFPFIFFKDTKKMPEWLNYLRTVLPTAILAFLVVYCLKDIDPSSAWMEMVCVALAAICYLYKRNALLAIAISTIVYMFLIK